VVLFSIFSKKKPIEEIVSDYAYAYNVVVNSGGNSKDGFKKLAEFSFGESIRLKRTIHTNVESAYSWYGFKIEDMTSMHNTDRKEIAGYIFNTIANTHKDFWEPVSTEKMNLLHRLIDEKLIGKISNVSSELKEELKLTCEKYNHAMIWEKMNTIDALYTCLKFAQENGYADSDDELIKVEMTDYTRKLKTIFEYSPTENGIRNVIVDSISDFSFNYFHIIEEENNLEIDDVKLVVDSIIFH
jgi:hypothetical protein